MLARLRIMILSALLSSIPLMGLAHTVDTTNFVVHQVMINGQSNLSNFWLRYTGNVKGQSEKNTSLNSDFKSDWVFNFPIDQFDAQNASIKSNFKKMLHSDLNPDITIRIDEEMCRLENKLDSTKKVLAYITIGGIERAVPIECVWKKTTPTGRQFAGKSTIRLSDFGLTPPKLFFGIINVKDRIMITFEVEAFLHK